jgi:flavin reductase (DIM6/NTAB) family NADH-FMN oxidoreductase RutF
MADYYKTLEPCSFYNAGNISIGYRGESMEKIKINNRPWGPFPVVIIGAEVNGRPNYVTIGACGVVSQKPVLYISLKASHYTTHGVKENGYFSVNIPSNDLVVKTDYCGTASGKTADKSTVFTAFYDEIGRAPLITECPMNLLCRVIEDIPVFDFKMFLGEIVAVYVNEQALSDGIPDASKINPMMLMGKNYWNTGDVAGSVYHEAEKYRP